MVPEGTPGTLTGLAALARGALAAACRKAGLHAGAWRHPEAEVLVFEAEVVDG